MSNSGCESEAAPDPWGRGWALWSHREEGSPHRSPRGESLDSLSLSSQVPLEALGGESALVGGKDVGEGEFSPCSALTLALQIRELLGFSGATQRLSKPRGFTLGVLHLCFPDSLEGKLCCLSAEGEDLFGEV